MDDDVHPGTTANIDRLSKSIRKSMGTPPLMHAAFVMHMPWANVAAVIVGPGAAAALYSSLDRDSGMVPVFMMVWCVLGTMLGSAVVGRWQARRMSPTFGTSVPDLGWFSVDGEQMTLWPTGLLGRVKLEAKVSIPIAGWRASVPKNGRLELHNPTGSTALLVYTSSAEVDIGRVLQAFSKRPSPG